MEPKNTSSKQGDFLRLFVFVRQCNEESKLTEIEVPLDKVQEDIIHAVRHSETAGFINNAALLSALLAVLAAVTALFAGHFANEAMIGQIQASDHWSYYQAKGIKLAIAEMRNESMPSEMGAQKIEKYRIDQAQIKVEAEQKELESKGRLLQHEVLASSVTVLQVAIALTAIAVLSRKKRFFYASAMLGAIGLLLLLRLFYL
jgi:hypothetical protein